MPKHIEIILEAAAEDMDVITETPEANHMFKVIGGGDTLTGMQSDLFQTLVEKICFVSCRSRPHIKTALAFLVTRVRNPDRGDHNKIVHTIHYIRETQVMDLALEAESMDTI